MKPEKPKKAKAVEKRTRPSVKAKSSAKAVTKKAVPTAKSPKLSETKKEPVVQPKPSAPAKQPAPPQAPVAAKQAVPAKEAARAKPKATPRKIVATAPAKQIPPVAPEKKVAPVRPLKRATPVAARKKTVTPSAAVKQAVEKPVAAPAKAIEMAPLKTTTTVATKRPATRKAPAVPSILLEGDAPEASRPSGPGQRYELGAAGTYPIATEAAELPEAYGTERLILIARDPHWLYAHWDMTADQLRTHNASSRDGHLVVRVFRDRPVGDPVLEQHVHPESRNWFLHVGRGATKYIAQLGFHRRTGGWQTIATSGATVTPPDVLSEDTSVRFETIPVEVPFTKLIEVVKEAVSEHLPLVEAIQELREAGHVGLPVVLPAPAQPVHTETASPRFVSEPTVPSEAPSSPSFSISIPVPQQWIPREWTPAQERALAQVISIDEVRRVWMGSLEITELIRRKLEHELASQAAAELGGGPGGPRAEQPGGVSSISSPFGGEQRRKGFWFNVNAELIIYGATEADATVTIGGRKIQLRRDGSFSFRFALPDGSYDLPVNATSADGDDSREARLSFRRATEFRGDVHAHPQDGALKTPKVENVR